MKSQININLIKFKFQYLYLVSEIIDNAFFVKKEFKKVCFIDNGFFTKQVLKIINKNFSNVTVVNITNINNLSLNEYDLIIAPYILQFVCSVDEFLQSVEKSLKQEGVLLTSAFNILSATSTINILKDFMVANKLRAQLVGFFEFGKKLNKYRFQEKTLDREKLIILDNNIELINVFCVKKTAENSNNSVKIVIE